MEHDDQIPIFLLVLVFNAYPRNSLLALLLPQEFSLEEVLNDDLQKEHN